MASISADTQGRRTTAHRPPLFEIVNQGEQVRNLAHLLHRDRHGLRTPQMTAYFTKQSPRTVKRWQPKMWPGFSAENQEWFDKRWADVRLLANAGWTTFVSVAPMIEPVILPDDFLALGSRTWVIVAGEQGAHDRCRDMDADWARAIRDQCKAAGIPFFMKQMAKGVAIPPDLQIRKFPNHDH